MNSNFLRTKLPGRIAACTALVALTAAGAAQASTVRTASVHSQTRSAAVQSTTTDSILTARVIDDPADHTFNQLLGINDQGVISGYFGSSALGHPNQGYTIAPPYNSNLISSFIPDNLPSSTQTQATGITVNSTTSGFWAPTNLGPGLDQNYGFIRWNVKNGPTLWLDVNDPLSKGTPKVQQVLGVNSSLNAVGFYNDKNNQAHGYVWFGSTGKFVEPFNNPNAAANSTVAGINNKNVICGFYLDKNTGVTKSFVQSLVTGQVIKYAVPHAALTQFFGINDANEAVGVYMGADNIPHGLIYNVAKRTLTHVDFGRFGTTLNGINNEGQAVGFFADGMSTLGIANEHGLLVGNIP